MEDGNLLRFPILLFVVCLVILWRGTSTQVPYPETPYLQVLPDNRSGGILSVPLHVPRVQSAAACHFAYSRAANINFLSANDVVAW